MTDLETSGGRLRIHLLGGFRITTHDGQTLIDESWGRSKARALLKLLALKHGHSVHRDMMIEALWPGRDPVSGANNLYKNVHYIRRTLAVGSPPVRLDRDRVSLRPGISTDVARFESLVANARPDDPPSMEEALAAYEGELLPGDPYEEWTEAPRERLRLSARRLRLDLAKLYVNGRRYKDATRVLEPLTLSDACDEEAHVSAIRAYAAGGDRTAALRQYERLRDGLREELDVDPSAEIQALIEDIRRADRDRAHGLTIVEALDREADQAAAFGGWSDAAARYIAALERLGTSDEELRYECEIRVKLGDTLRSGGRSMEAAEQYRRVVDVAAGIGAADVRARAIYCYQEEADAGRENDPGQREALELVESALATLAPEELSARALLLAAGSRPLVAAGKSLGEELGTGRLAMAGPLDPRVESRLREGVDLARQGNDGWVRVVCLEKLRTFLAGPRTIKSRLELTSEMFDISRTTASVRIEASARMARHEDLLELGDIDGARIQARQMARLAHRTSSPLIGRFAAWMLAAHATADGDLDEAKRLIFEARDSVQEPDQHSNVGIVFAIQLFMLRWHQGRIAEMEAGCRASVDSSPGVAVIRAALALIYAETGRPQDARSHYEILLKDGATGVPQDMAWWLVTNCVASVAIRLRDETVAAALFSLIAPYAHLNASVANSVSLGSASLVLGQLATALGDWDTAEERFDDALKFNIRTRQHVWTARTRLEFAKMLSARAKRADRTRADELLRLALVHAKDLGLADVEIKATQSSANYDVKPGRHRRVEP